MPHDPDLHYHRSLSPAGYWYVGGGGGNGLGPPFNVEVCIDAYLDTPLTPQATFTPVPTHLAQTRTAAVATATAAGPGTPLPTAHHTTPTNTATPVPPDDCTDYSISSPLAFDIAAGSAFWQVGYDSKTSSRLFYKAGPAGGSQRVPRSPHTVGTVDTFTFWPEVLAEPLPATLRICGPHSPDDAPSDPTATALASLTPARPTPLVPEEPNYNETQIAQLEDILDELRDDDPPLPVPTIGPDPTDTNDEILAEMATQQATAQSGEATIQSGIATTQAEIATNQAEAFNPIAIDPIATYVRSTPTILSGDMAVSTITSAFDGKEPFDTIDEVTSIYSDTADIFINSDGADCSSLSFLDIDINWFGLDIVLDMNHPFCVFIEKTTEVRTILRLASLLLLAFVVYRYMIKRTHELST